MMQIKTNNKYLNAEIQQLLLAENFVSEHDHLPNTSKRIYHQLSWRVPSESNHEQKVTVHQQESDYENEDGMEADEECNIIILGDCMVGKTKITRQFGCEEYLPFYMKTLGMDFENVSLTVLDLLVECKIVDISGQERFHTKDIFNTYLSTANAIIFIYDITNLTTYHNIQRKWLPMVEDKVSPECALVLVGYECIMGICTGSSIMSGYTINANDVHRSEECESNLWDH